MAYDDLVGKPKYNRADSDIRFDAEFPEGSSYAGEPAAKIPPGGDC
jgi:hypothetical protein